MDSALYHGEGRDTVDYLICISNALHNSLKKVLQFPGGKTVK